MAGLVRFVGWGSLSQVFVENHAAWGRVGAELRRLLGREDYEKAEASTTNAHYTSGAVIRGIHRILDRLGFRGGSVLEPALGVGHFIGLLPEEWMPNTRWTGIELDPDDCADRPGSLPRVRYPHPGFEEAMIEDDSYDLVVSNVPFGRYPVYDPVHNLLGFVSTTASSRERWISHRRFRELPRLSGREWLTRWSTVIVAVLAFGFLGALIALVSDPSGLMKGNTDRLNLALTIPVLAPVLVGSP